MKGGFGCREAFRLWYSNCGGVDSTWLPNGPSSFWTKTASRPERSIKCSLNHDKLGFGFSERVLPLC